MRLVLPICVFIGIWAAITYSSAAQSALPKTIAEAPTRFGVVNIVEECDSDNFCSEAYATFGGKTVEVGASSDQIYVSVLATFQVHDGDLVILDIPAGARDTPDQLVALLMRDSTSLEVISNEEFYSAEDKPLLVEIDSDRIKFDLGYEDKKHKIATYEHGALSITHDTAKETSLPKSDCASVLGAVHECLSFDKCTDAAIADRISMATLGLINSLANRPEFQSDAFDEECQKICASRKYDLLRVRKHLCGY